MPSHHPHFCQALLRICIAFLITLNFQTINNYNNQQQRSSRITVALAYSVTTARCLNKNSPNTYIESPGYSRGLYPADATRTWIFVSSPATCISFSFKDVDLSSTSGDDYIDIYDGTSVSDRHLFRVSNDSSSSSSTAIAIEQQQRQLLARDVQSSRNTMTVVFNSAASAGTKGRGFAARVAVTANNCTTTTTRSSSATLSSSSLAGWRLSTLCIGGVGRRIQGESPGYSSRRSYPPNMHRSWLFVSDTFTCIRFRIKAASIEDSNFCKNDRIVVYDGASSTATPQPQLVACGSFLNRKNDTTTVPSVTSSRNVLFVAFHTDDNRKTGRGFEYRLDVVKCDDDRNNNNKNEKDNANDSEKSLPCRKNLIVQNGVTLAHKITCGQPVCAPIETGALPTHLARYSSEFQKLFRVADHSWPWQAQVLFCMQQDHEQECQHICGGALLSRRHVLSAAHCFEASSSSSTTPIDPSRYRIGFGIASSGYGKNNEQWPEIEAIDLHPDFGRRAKFDSDLAMIRLKEPGVTLNDYVRPVCLPANILHQWPPSGAVCYMTGFGASGRQLRQVALPIISNSLCAERILPDAVKADDSGVRTNNQPPLIPQQNVEAILTENMLCAGYERGVHDACSGDSGGPLVCKLGRGNTWTLDGVVSFGVAGQCAAVNKSGAYVRVARFLSWIHSRAFDLTDTLR